MHNILLYQTKLRARNILLLDNTGLVYLPVMQMDFGKVFFCVV